MNINEKKQMKIAPNVWPSSVKIPTMEDDIREDEEWCYQCRYICCDTIFRQKWKFDRHIASWWELNPPIKSEIHILFFQSWNAGQWVLWTKQVSWTLDKFSPPYSCWVIICFAPCLFLKCVEFCSILRASPGYYLRKTYHSCRYESNSHFKEVQTFQLSTHRICNKEILCDKGPLQVCI